MKTKILVALAVATIATVTSPSVNAQAPVIHNVDFTEHSSSSLTATYDGTAIPASAVVNTSPDHWTVTLPVTADFLYFGTPLGWVEPDFAPPVFPENFLTFPSVSGNQIFVSSDQPGLALIPGVIPNGMSIPIGVVPGGPINVQNLQASITDLGDPVPDTGSSFGLLSLSLIALLGASRFRSLRPA